MDLDGRCVACQRWLRPAVGPYPAAIVVDLDGQPHEVVVCSAVCAFECARADLTRLLSSLRRAAARLAPAHGPTPDRQAG